MKFRINNFAEFWKIRGFFWKIRKKSDFKLKNWDFFFKIPLLRRSFFRDFFFVWNFAHLIFRTNKFSEFWNIWDFFKKIRKKFTKFSKNRDFFFQNPTAQEVIFSRFFFVWNFAHLNFRTNKFSEFWNIWDFFKKIRLVLHVLCP